MRSMLLMLPLALLSSTAALAATAPLTPGNIVVAVSGKGASGITFTDNQASPLSLYQYTPTGNNHATFAGSSVVYGSVNPISSEYGSSSEGMLQRSGDGKSLTIMGDAINAATFNNATSCPTPTTCTNSYVPQTSANSGKYAALAQTSSVANTSNGLTGANAGTVPTVARVIANITADGNVDTSTALLGVFDQNNPRSVYTQNGTSYYVSGQGVSGDTTGGVFYATEGASSATSITGLDASGGTATQDTRDVTVYNGQLYTSVDSKSGSNAARSFVGTLGNANALPTTVANNGNGPTMLLGYADGKGKMTMTAATGNGLNTGKQINLSPEQFFFADPNTLYVSDAGVSKQTSANSTVGDGGLQKWTQTNGTWSLAYTLSAGLGLVTNTSAAGTTGLFGLAGKNNGDGTVSFYATSYTINDTDTSYLYAITDTLGATSGAGESFTVIDSTSDSKFMGAAFAPDAQTSAVPEPANWALMVAGFGLLGGALRRRSVAFA